MSEQNSKEQALYQQNCENYRYYNRLKWSRVQIIIAIETGLILAICKFELSQAEKILFIIAGSIIILLFCFLSLSDRRDENFFWDKMREYQGWPSENPLGLTRGSAIIIIAIVLTLLFNCLVLARY